MKPYLLIIPKPTTHDNPRLQWETASSGKKQAVIYFECLADATEFIQTESIMDESLTFHLAPVNKHTDYGEALRREQ